MVSIDNIVYSERLMRFPISDSPRRMGRPPLNVKPVLVHLGDDQPDRIDALVGSNGRSRFIREAVEKELAKRERKAASGSG
jgi:hypothetical protein